MECKPSIGALAFGESKEYSIVINNDENFKGVLLECVPFNAQIGIIRHELAHIVDYQRRTKFGILQRGLDCLSEKSKAAFEKEIDLITISRGLGWQLYDWADFVMYKSEASSEYKEFKKKTYMKPEEIHEIILSCELYKDVL